MHILIAIALKSVLIAGIALGLLALMKNRSAAERSWVAHIGLLALVLLALAPLALPRWNVEAPALLGRADTPAITAQAAPAETASVAPAAVSAPAPSVAAPSPLALSPTAAATAVYAVPAALLLLITFLALARLIALRARADVLVDGHWLSALARAQRRMGFKHGTALLTSNELSSPISWGLMRPVILLNNRAVEAAGEAEAIIAHELAHVARMDWIKLLLARIATALFWFNPLVWVLAREAHQLREEAADDAVLAADIADTDYAQLLVGVARHECPGLLLGAHGVAPSKSSLARRVARVLDGASARGPVARSFAMGVLVGAVLIAAPLAALTLTPAGTTELKQRAYAASGGEGEPSGPYYAAAEAPTDLASIIADGVSTSVATAVAAVASDKVVEPVEPRAVAIAAALEEAAEVRAEALAEAGKAAAKARAAVNATTTTTTTTTSTLTNRQIDRIIEMKTLGITPEYVDAMRAAAPRLRHLDPSEFVGMKAVGVTPEFARGLASAGFHNITADQLTEARAVGLTGDYARAVAAAGIPPKLDDYVELRAVGVPPSYIQAVHRAGYRVRNADKLVEMYAVGVKPADLTPTPPTPPKPRDRGRSDEDPDDG